MRYRAKRWREKATPITERSCKPSPVFVARRWLRLLTRCQFSARLPDPRHHLRPVTASMQATAKFRREAVGPVIAVAGEAADDAGAIPAHHQPVAVVLDFMNPQRAGRWLLRLRRHWFDEAKGMPHSHSRRLGQRRFNDGLPLVTHQPLHSASLRAVI